MKIRSRSKEPSNVEPCILDEPGPFSDEIETLFGFVAHELFNNAGRGGSRRFAERHAEQRAFPGVHGRFF